MMKEKILYGYTGIFNSPDEIKHAAEKASEEGFTKYDVHTPYPLHGMNQAMKLEPSKLGYVALVLGLSALLGTVISLWWVSSVEYPIIVGGKPFFSFPAFVPVIFEVTVLTASVGTVLAMLFVFFKLPNNSHPLNGTEYMKKVSSDKFGLFIHSEDPKFDESSVKSFFEKIYASEVEAVYWDEEEINYKNKIFEPKFIGFLVVAALITSGAAYFSLNKLMNIVPFNWMMEQEKQNPQQKSLVFADGFGMRQPVDGTIARGYLPYKYKGEPDLAAEKLINPLPVSKEVLSLGQKKYDTYCSPCHDFQGTGVSRLRGQYPNPPSLHSEKVRNWKDGRIYAVIMDGQNVMSSYSTQLEEDERWAVIHYVRALQRSQNAKESDIK
ncbi:MAG: quinol:electron acceptor oxidoreductase subunit ActD [Bacteroidota bacterium]